MTTPILVAALVPALLAATVDVAPGADLGAAVRAARAGDVVRLAPGEYAASLGRLHVPLRIAGAGAGVTVVIAPEGEDGLVVEGGEVQLAGLTLVAQGPRAALKVLGGRVRARGVGLAGGAVGAFVDGGRLDGEDLDLSGRYGLLLRSGEASLDGARARGAHAALAQLGGRATLRHVTVTGPATEAGITISGGTALVDDALIRAPGPSGLSVHGAAKVEARAIVVSGATETDGILGDCVQVRRGTLALEASALTRCGGAALESLGGTVDVRGVDAVGGEAGCLVFLEKASARLDGNRCFRRGPAVVAASGAQVRATMNRWQVDPVLWVDCGSGARIYLGVGETSRQPCGNPGDSLDKPRRP
jgi:hypothetical protein